MASDAALRPAPDLRLKRAFDPPAPEDGARVLVDRMWPRDRTRADLRLADWPREIAPSHELRRWAGTDPARFAEYRLRYREELTSPEQIRRLDAILARAAAGRVTLLTTAVDLEHSNAAILREVLLERAAERARSARPVPRPRPAG